MAQRVGMDVTSVAEVQEQLSRRSHRYLARVYSPAEIRQCQGDPGRLAERFAAKEAVRKLLAGPEGIAWTAIEVLDGRARGLRVRLTGAVAERAAGLGVTDVAITTTRANGYATAVALGKDAA